MAESTKRDEICLVKAPFVVLGERRDVVNRQAAVNEQAVCQTYAATVKVALENKFCCSLPQLRIAEFIGLRVARSVVVKRLAMPCVNATADRAEAFYLKFHTTIIAYLFVTFVTNYSLRINRE